MKVDIKVWNWDVFGHLESEKKNCLMDIEELDVKDEGDALPESLRTRRLVLINHVEENNKKLESMFRQKARANWLTFGDSNSKFNHYVIRWKRLRNEVKGVEVGSFWVEESKVARREVVKLFEAKFSATQDFGVRLEHVEFKSLLEEVSLSLVSKITEEEVKDVVWLYEGSKSPEPDDFNFNFIKNSWEVLKLDVVAVVHPFQETSCISKECNASFIILVPKVRDPISLDQYKPISLVGSLYKIISKVLSCRIKQVLPEVIDDCQSTFLK